MSGSLLIGLMVLGDLSVCRNLHLGGQFVPLLSQTKVTSKQMTNKARNRVGETSQQMDGEEDRGMRMEE